MYKIKKKKKKTDHGGYAVSALRKPIKGTLFFFYSLSALG